MDEAALELRFREHATERGEPDVDAFRPAAAPPPERAEALAVLRGSRPLAPGAPLVLFFQHTGYGIPAVGESDRVLDLSSWCVQPTVFGWLASVPPTRSRAASPRVAWVIAACLPLAIPTQASAAAGPAEVQRPRTGKPKSKSKAEPKADAKAEPESGEGDEPEPEPEAESDEETWDAEAPSDASLDPDVLAPPSPPPAAEEPPPPPARVRGVDQATIDAAWEGVDGYEVELELKGGAALRGRIGAVQRDTFTLIQSQTGQVLVLPKSGVVSLRVYTPPPIPTKRGTGMIVGGSILASIGTPVFISGVVMLGIYPSGVAIHLPLLFIGGGALASGIPMLVAGSRRRAAYLEAVQQHELSPVVMRTRDGWTGGLRFRF